MTFMTGPDVRRNRGRPPGSASTAQFRHRDLKYAIKAARDAGLENFRVTVDKAGAISVVPLAGDLAPEKSNTDGANEWDELLKKDKDGG